MLEKVVQSIRLEHGICISEDENLFLVPGSWFLVVESLIPSVEGRLWSPERGHGWLAVAGLSVPVRLSRILTLVPEGRVDIGSIERTSGGTADIAGFGASLFLRGSF